MEYLEISYQKCAVSLLVMMGLLGGVFLAISLMGILMRRWSASGSVGETQPVERSVFLAGRYLGLFAFLGQVAPAGLRAVLAGENVDLWIQKGPGVLCLGLGAWVLLVILFQVYDYCTPWFSIRDAVGLTHGLGGVSMKIVIINSSLWIGCNYLSGQFIHEAIRASFPGF